MEAHHLPLMAAVVPAVLGSGCDALLPRRDVPPQGQLPDVFSAYRGNAEAKPPGRWWKDFGSPELDAIMADALTDNLTLRQAWARLDQAHAVIVEEASPWYPQISADGDADYRRTARMVETVAPTGNGSTSEPFFQRVTTNTRQFGLSMLVSYEVDLWGRIRAHVRAAEWDLEATREDLDTAAMTLAAEIVTRWLDVLEQQALEAILREQLETNKTYLELVELRFRNAAVSALDVYQQRQAVSEVAKLIPLVEAQAQVAHNELAVLLGRPPGTDLSVGTYDLQEVPPPPAAGVPADLLIHRPDVRAALARLQAADYRVAVARADRLPSLRLTGGIGYDADDIKYFFDDWFLNLASNVTTPLFTGWRLKAEVDRTLAVVEEELAAYRLTVLIAMQEVEDALILERKQREHIGALTQQLEDAGNALKEAGQRYLKGLNDYLPVLTALEGTQQLARNLVTARRDLLIYRVNLYRALGGDWMSELEPPPRLSDETELAGADEPW